MKKKILLLLVFIFFIFSSTDKKNQILYGFDSGKNEDWYVYDDSYSQGNSKASLNVVKKGADNTKYSIKFDYQLNTTNNWEWPYSGFGFTFKDNYDLSIYNGIEFYVKSSGKDTVSIEINIMDEKLNTNKPCRYTFNTGNKFIKIVIPFKKFQIANWWIGQNPGYSEKMDFSKVVKIEFTKNGAGGESGSIWVDEFTFYKGEADTELYYTKPPKYYKKTDNGKKGKNPAKITVDINSVYIDPYSDNSGRINEKLYGSNWGSWLGLLPPADKVKPLNLKMLRIGGNLMSRYNWRNSKYTHNTSVMNDTAVYQPSLDEFIIYCKKIKAEPVIQINAMGWAPDEKNGKFSNCMSVKDAVDLIKYLNSKKKYGVKYFEIDNEPFIWHLTHKDVVKKPLSVDEYIKIYTEYSLAMKKAQAEISSPDDIKIMGPAICTAWNGFKTFNMKDNYDGLGSAIPYFLKEMKKIEDDRKINPNAYKLLDIFSFHLYPSYRTDYSDPESFIPEGVPKMLESAQTWWNKDYINKYDYSQPRGVSLYTIPKINQWINKYNPGVKLAVTEFGVDAANMINYDPILKPIYMADLYGIMAKYGVDYAMQFCLDSDQWGLGLISQYYDILPQYYPLMLFSNHFKGTLLNADSDKGDLLNVYACDDGEGNIALMIINKNKTDYNAQIKLKGYTGNAVKNIFYHKIKNYSLTVIKIPKSSSNIVEVWEYGAQQIYSKE